MNALLRPREIKMLGWFLQFARGEDLSVEVAYGHTTNLCLTSRALDQGQSSCITKSKYGIPSTRRRGNWTTDTFRGAGAHWALRQSRLKSVTAQKELRAGPLSSTVVSCCSKGIHHSRPANGYSIIEGRLKSTSSRHQRLWLNRAHNESVKLLTLSKGTQEEADGGDEVY